MPHPTNWRITLVRSQDTHWFNAREEGGDGRVRNFSVSKRGRSIYIQEIGGHRHLCHPSVNSIESVKREILLVYHVSVSEAAT